MLLDGSIDIRNCSHAMKITDKSVARMRQFGMPEKDGDKISSAIIGVIVYYY